jgi:ribonuclease P protein subunit RPR2
MSRRTEVVQERQVQLLLVDDDTKFRTLLRTTFEAVDVEVDEAADAAEAEARAAGQRPDVIVLDVGLPGVDGIELCRRFKNRRATEDIRVVLLTGREDVEGEAARAGADALLLKPFRPLELLTVVERLAAGQPAMPLRTVRARSEEEQLLLYARDLRHLVELERGQRSLLEGAYRETVSALATALETKDTGTRQHSQRVQHYALELARALDPLVADHPSVEYGFLLHDIGKIGIPDQILRKPAPLTDPERRLMQSHTILGAQMLGAVAFLRGPGVDVVRSHHERWDGTGYPDGLAGEEIPLGARIFAVADALDAITSDRPYRRAQSWRTAHREIVASAGTQFDPDVVDAFLEREHALHEIRRAFLVAA